MTKYVTRIAPSPTGDMHIGTARTAYFNWLAARASGGKFILRIDDTDQKRHDEGSVRTITKTMEWLGLNYDSYTHQTLRTALYRAVLEALREKGWTREEHGATLLQFPEDLLPHIWVDKIAGVVTITKRDREGIKDLVLMKSDGTPTYHFASTVDDQYLAVNLVIRGIDHFSNTAKHVALAWAISLAHGRPPELPEYVHVGLIHKDGKPLSKRDGAAGMLKYREAGYDPDAMLNFLARLGWGPHVDDKSTALLPRERMLELFLTGGTMRASPANFDQAKLDSFDRKYKARKKVTDAG